MRLQLLSDLHLETEVFEPTAAPGAELLILAGDIDSSWDGLAKFRHWPVPVIFVAGNHEFDQREMTQAWPALRDRCSRLGIRMLECESVVITDNQGLRVRFVATVRWSDFDLFGVAERERCMRAATYYLKIMRATRNYAVLDAAAVREEALICGDWLRSELKRPKGSCDRTVVITHFAPSFRSADPRYGSQPGTASFCNADDDLLRYADLWIHGHLHCQHDYQVPHEHGTTRVVCNSRGHVRKGEAEGHRPTLLLEV